MRSNGSNASSVYATVRASEDRLVEAVSCAVGVIE